MFWWLIGETGGPCANRTNRMMDHARLMSNQTPKWSRHDLIGGNGLCV